MRLWAAISSTARVSAGTASKLITTGQWKTEGFARHRGARFPLMEEQC